PHPPRRRPSPAPSSRRRQLRSRLQLRSCPYTSRRWWHPVPLPAPHPSCGRCRPKKQQPTQHPRCALPTSPDVAAKHRHRTVARLRRPGRSSLSSSPCTSGRRPPFRA
ncbi:hypothetical protein OC842_005032, partial [Tilletia horrida]